MKKNILIIFFLCFVVRVLYSLLIGFYNNYKLEADSVWLIKMADKAVNGDFNFDIGRFIASPLFPSIAAVFKIMFGKYWNTALIFFQIILSSISGIYIYKIGVIVFNKQNVGLLAGLIYAIFPLTLYFANTFSQETLFQCLFIITIYYFIVSYKYNNYKYVFISSVFFSLAYLTKSHILLFSLFVPIIYLICIKSKLRAIYFTTVFAVIALVCSLPYGIYHLYKNQIYVISSNGLKYQFYIGNTEVGYISVVNIPKQNTKDFKLLKDVNVTAGYFNGNQSRYDSLLFLPQSIKQSLFLHDAYKWIKQNPEKVIKMKIYNLFYYLLPGVSFKYYPFKQWLLSFIISFPVYLFAYLGLFFAMIKNFKQNIWAISIFLSLFLFSVVLYNENRFRTITIEPIYIIYASYFLLVMFEKYASKQFEYVSKKLNTIFKL